MSRSTSSPLNLPNLVTLSRLGWAVLLFTLIAWEVWGGCLAILAVSAFSDWLDGFLARRWHLTTALGRVLDPLMDKVLLNGAFIFLLPQGTREGWLTAWMVALVVARELLVTGLRGFLEAEGIPFGADWLGKWKTVLQFAALIAIFVYQSELLQLGMEHVPFGVVWSARLRDTLLYTMLLVTLLSGFQYFWRGGVVLLRSPHLGQSQLGQNTEDSNGGR